MFQNIYPVFEPKRTFKKKRCWKISGIFPEACLELQYQKLQRWNSVWNVTLRETETGMILLPGILCYKGVPYFLERPYPVSCKSRRKKWHM